MHKENAQPHNEAGPSAQVSANSTKTPTLTPRQRRVLDALMTGGWLQRESVDRIAGASNGPQIIRELRTRLLGQDGIETERVESVDRDGKTCKPGRYRLTPNGLGRIPEALLGGSHG